MEYTSILKALSFLSLDIYSHKRNISLSVAFRRDILPGSACACPWPPMQLFPTRFAQPIIVVINRLNAGKKQNEYLAFSCLA